MLASHNLRTIDPHPLLAYGYGYGGGWGWWWWHDVLQPVVPLVANT